MLVDVPTMFFLTLSIFTFLKALQNGGVWIPVSAIAVFSAVFSKYSVWIMLSVLGAVFLVYAWKGRERRREGADNGGRNPELGTRKYMYRAAWVALLGGVLIGTVLLLKYDVISEQINFLREYQAPGLRRWGESFISTFFYQTHPFITVAAVSSIYVAFKKRDVKFIIIVWLILIVVILQIRRSRYVMIVFPMFTLMASYGLQQIRSMELKRYIVSCIMASSIIVAVFSYLPFLQTMSTVNLKNAGTFLNSIEAKKIEVFTIPSTKSAVNFAVAVPLLDLFTDKDILYSHDTKYSLPFEKIEKSPLRFTWEYKNPKYYMDDQKGLLKYPAIVVISNRGEKILPERIKDNLRGYERIKTFETTTDLFRYSPVVTIYVQKNLK